MKVVPAVQALYADALKATKEHKRAVVGTVHMYVMLVNRSALCSSPALVLQMYYRKALSLRQRHEPKHSGCATPNSGVVVDERAKPAPVASMAPEQEACREGTRSRARGTFCESDAVIAYKVAVCYQELRDWEAAANELDAIPQRLRSATVCNLLGRLYRHMCHVGKAIDAFKVLLQALLVLHVTMLPGRV